MKSFITQICVYRPQLLQVNAAVLFLAALLTAVPLTAQQILAPTNLPNVLTVPVNSGDTSVSIPFKLNNSGHVLLQVLVPLDDARISIVDSSNIAVADSAIVFTPANELGISGVPGGSFELEDIVLPAGLYHVNVSFPAAGGQTAIMLTTGISPLVEGPSYEIAVVVPKARGVVGDIATVGVLILKDGLPITGLEPELLIVDESGNASPIALLDNGLDADGLVNDGLYSAEIELSVPGNFDLNARALLIMEGKEVEVTARGTITILPQIGQITDVESQLIMASEGCINGLRQTVSLNLLEAATYVVAGGLAADTGLIEKRVRDDFLPGTANVSFMFNASQLRRAVVSGQSIRAIAPELFSLGETIDFQDVAPIVLDLAVQPEQLCRENPIIFGSVSVDPVIVNSYIDALEFSVIVDVNTSGSHKFSFTVAASGQQVAVVSFNQLLQAGENTVTFLIDATDVQTIDGPYHVVSALVTGPAGSLQRSNLGGSEFYSRWQFTPGRQGDLNGDGAVDKADQNLLATFRNTEALYPGDRRDLNGDSVIDIRDLRMILQLN